MDDSPDIRDTSSTSGEVRARGLTREPRAFVAGHRMSAFLVLVSATMLACGDQDDDPSDTVGDDQDAMAEMDVGDSTGSTDTQGDGSSMGDSDEPVCECPPGELCTLDPAGLPQCEAGCDERSPCADGFFCQDSVCTEGCAADSDCPGGTRCNPSNSECEPGCRLSAECPGGTACTDGVCARVACLSDGQCNALEVCEEQVCNSVVGRACQDSTDCGARAVCAGGACYECANSDDCRSGQVCLATNRCGLAEGPRATWTRHETSLATFNPGYNARDLFGHGPGIALLDMNSDGLLDVALGRVLNDLEAGLCVFLNRSDSMAVRFERDEELCDGGIPAEAVHVTDLNGNGVDELLTSARGQLMWYEPGSSAAFVDLFSSLDEDDIRRDCLAGTSLSVDIDADGFLDVLLGCQIVFTESASDPSPTRTPNILLTGSAGGPQWAYSVDEVATAGLDDPGFTLAFGAFIDHETGLWNILNANDTFSVRGRRNTDFAPGLQQRALAPDLWAAPTGLPQFELSPILPDASNWGSFMGVAQLHSEAGDALVLISDWGPIRALRPDSNSETGWVDIAAEVGLAMEALNGFQLYSWTTLVDDFNNDGRDDVFVVHGMVPDSNVQAHTSHRHVQAFQSADGTFELEYEGFGVTLPEERPRGSFPIPPSGRSALRWDANLDGRMDIIINYHLGPPEFYSLDESPLRCTLRPQPTTVMAMNAGYAVDRGDGVWRSWDHGGQHRASPPSSLVVPGDSIRLRFPSGAVVPVSCADGPYQTVEEPDWLARVPGTSIVSIQSGIAGIDAPSSVRALWRRSTQQGIVDLEPGDDPTEWQLPSAADDAAILLQIDGRWIWRWFP